MNTRQAFEKIVNTKAIYNKLGMKRQNWNTIKNRFVAGTLTTDAMTTILERLEYKKIKEEQWSPPKPEKENKFSKL